MNAVKAIAELRAGIAAVRKECADDPDCKTLLSALSTAEVALSAYAGGEPDADDQPQNLKDAATEAKRQLASKRESASKAQPASTK